MSQELKLELEKDLLDLCVYTDLWTKNTFLGNFSLPIILFCYFLNLVTSVYYASLKNHKRYLIEIVCLVYLVLRLLNILKND